MLLNWFRVGTELRARRRRRCRSQPASQPGMLRPELPLEPATPTRRQKAPHLASGERSRPFDSPSSPQSSQSSTEDSSSRPQAPADDTLSDTSSDDADSDAAPAARRRTRRSGAKDSKLVGTLPSEQARQAPKKAKASSEKAGTAHADASTNAHATPGARDAGGVENLSAVLDGMMGDFRSVVAESHRLVNSTFNASSQAEHVDAGRPHAGSADVAADAAEPAGAELGIGDLIAVLEDLGQSSASTTLKQALEATERRHARALARLRADADRERTDTLARLRAEHAEVLQTETAAAHSEGAESTKVVANARAEAYVASVESGSALKDALAQKETAEFQAAEAQAELGNLREVLAKSEPLLQDTWSHWKSPRTQPQDLVDDTLRIRDELHKHKLAEQEELHRQMLAETLAEQARKHTEILMDKDKRLAQAAAEKERLQQQLMGEKQEHAQSLAVKDHLHTAETEGLHHQLMAEKEAHAKALAAMDQLHEETLDERLREQKRLTREALDAQERCQHATAAKKVKVRMERMLVAHMHNRRLECFVAWQNSYYVNAEVKQMKCKVLNRIRNQAVCSAFDRWAASTAARKDERLKMDKVVRRIQNMAVAAALSEWCLHIQSKIETRAVLGKAVRRIQNMAVAAALSEWRHCTRTSKHAKELSGKVLQRIRNQAISSSFTSWMVYTRQQKRVKSIVSRMLSGLLEYSFTEWAQATTAALTKRAHEAEVNAIQQRLLASAAQRLKMRAVAKTMQSWCAFSRRHKDDRLKLAKVVRRLQNMAVAAALSEWHLQIQLQIQTHTVLGKAVRRIQNMAVAAALSEWCLHIQSKIETRAVLGKAVRRIQNMAVAAALSEWRHCTRTSKHAKELSGKVLQRIRNQAISSSFTSWMVYTRQQKRVKSIVSRMLSGLLEYSFTEWAQAIAEDAAEKRRLRELAGFHSEMETQKNSMKILARAVQTWCAFARHKAARLQAMHRVMQRIQNMALSCCFRQWQATAHHAARVRSIGTRAMKHISNLAIAKAFGAMCAYVRRRKLIRSILTRLRHQLAWSVFTEWMDLVAREVHKRRQQQLLHEENAAAMEARASAHDAEIRALKAEVYAAKARLETHERYVVDNIAEIEKHHTEQLDAHREQYQQIIADVKHEHAGELARVYTQALQEAFAVRPAAEIPAVAERNPEELLQQAARRIRNVQMANGFTRWCGFAQGRKRHRQAPPIAFKPTLPGN